MFTLTPKNQHNYTNTSIGMCPNCLTKDITIRYNWATRAGGLFQIQNGQGSHGGDAVYAKEGNSYSLHDLVLEQASCTPRLSSGTLYSAATRVTREAS